MITSRSPGRHYIVIAKENIQGIFVNYLCRYNEMRNLSNTEGGYNVEYGKKSKIRCKKDGR